VGDWWLLTFDLQLKVALLGSKLVDDLAGVESRVRPLGAADPQLAGPLPRQPQRQAAGGLQRQPLLQPGSTQNDHNASFGF